jgi:hypothetical protein
MTGEERELASRQLVGRMVNDIERFTRELEEARFERDSFMAAYNEERARLVQAEASLQIQTNEAATHLDAWRKEAALHTRAAVDVMRLTRELEAAITARDLAVVSRDMQAAEHVTTGAERDLRARLVQVEAERDQWRSMAHLSNGARAERDEARAMLREQGADYASDMDTALAERDRYRSVLVGIADNCSNCTEIAQAALSRVSTPPEGGAE